MSFSLIVFILEISLNFRATPIDGEFNIPTVTEEMAMLAASEVQIDKVFLKSTYYQLVNS